MGSRAKATQDKPPKVTERAVLRAVRKYLQASGWFVVRIQQSLGAHRGMSDLIAVRDGRVLFIEVKAPNGRLSEYQERFRQELEAHGGTYLVVRGLQDVAHLGPLGDLWGDPACGSP